MPVYDEENKSKDLLNPSNNRLKPNYSGKSLESAENKASENQGSSNENQYNNEKSALNKIEESSFFRPSVLNNKSGSGGLSGRRKIAIGASIVSLILSIFIGILSYIPLQIAHIKESFRRAYGGTQESTLVRRKMRVYNRAFFFTKDGEFDGYKEKGVFGFAKNRSSKKLITDLESKGFKVNAELTQDGKWTGRFREIEYKGQKITGANSSIWERRSAVRTALAEEYPTRGFMWRSKQARKVYSRYGLNRTAWWNDNAATRKIDDIEIRFRKKVRDAFRRNAPVDLGVDAPKSPTDEDGKSTNPDADKVSADEAAKAKAELDTNTKASIDADVTSPKPPNPIGELVEDAARNLDNAAADAAKKSVIGAIKITGAVEAACTGIKTLNQIESGSRTIKRLQLLKSFTVYMSLIDAVRTGDVDSKDVGAFMNLMTSKDPDTGKNAYQSGGWLWASRGSGKEPRYGNTFNTGGGTTGVLKNFRTTSYSIVGGPGKVEGTCDTVSNGWFQLGSAIVGIGAAIFSGGTFTAGNFAANFAITTAVEMIRSFATPILTNLAAGTIVNGWEKGEKFGDMLSAASGSAHYAQGSQLGMRPLKKPERAALMEEYDQILRDEFRQKPFYAQLFDLSDTKSILSMAVIKSPRNVSDIASLLVKPLGVFHGKAKASEEGYECNDEEVIDNDIATDPFCNPILGESGLDRIDPIDNIKWMLSNNYIDDNGTPQGDYAEYVSKCFENQNIETLFDVKDFTTTYNERCVSSGESDKFLRFRAFRIDNGLLECIDLELDQGSCEGGSAGASASSTTTTSSSNTTFPGFNGTSVPCKGAPRTKIRIPNKGGALDWTGIKESGVLGKNSDGKDIKVYVREACTNTSVKTAVIFGSIHGSENGGQLVAHDLLFNAQLPENVKIIAVPEINGYGVSLFDRNNKNGVDLNRNFPERWSELTEKDEDNPNSQFYRGPSAASEPETKAVMAFLNSLTNVSAMFIYHHNLGYAASVGDTNPSVGKVYADSAGMPNTNSKGSNVINQHGSLDLWFSKTTKVPTVLVELYTSSLYTDETKVSRQVKAVVDTVNNNLIKAY